VLAIAMLALVTRHIGGTAAVVLGSIAVVLAAVAFWTAWLAPLSLLAADDHSPVRARGRARRVRRTAQGGLDLMPTGIRSPLRARKRSQRFWTATAGATPRIPWSPHCAVKE